MQQVQGYPRWHTKEPTTEDSYTVPAKGCIPRDGDYALPVDHIAITALPVKHRATDDDYALPVDCRGAARKQIGVSVLVVVMYYICVSYVLLRLLRMHSRYQVIYIFGCALN